MLHRTIVCSLTLSLLSGCVLNRQRREIIPGPKVGQVNPLKSGQSTIRFVEFDDQGKLWSPGQLEGAIADIRTAKLAFKKKMTDLGLPNPREQVIVMLYVHGWKNNSSEKGLSASGDPAKFEKSIADTIAIQQAKSAKEGNWPIVPVVGVYLAWRGQVAPVEPLKTLSFFDRAWAARRVAGPPTVEAVARIMKATKQDDAYSRCILVGHSFGAVVLERSILPLLVSQIVYDKSGGGFPLPADLIVLANSANDAGEADQMIDFLRRWNVKPRANNGHSRPLIFAVTAGGDNATKLLLPFGHSPYLLYQFLLGSYRRPPPHEAGQVQAPHQAALNIHSAGHSPKLWSHSATDIGCPAGADNIARTPDNFVYKLEEPGKCVEIKPLPNPAGGKLYNTTPFWVLRVPPSVSKNHGDIWGENFRRMLYAILEESGIFDMNRPSPAQFDVKGPA